MNNCDQPTVNIVDNELQGKQITEEASFQQQLESQIKLLSRELKESQREIILKLSKIVAEHSRETGAHIRRVAELSHCMALKAGLSKEDAELLKLASPMHDVGKVSIPDNILHKPGPLSDDEFEIMKTHTTVGYEMLKGSRRKVLQTAAIVALQHHEKYNGKGYPLGLQGERINILGRITGIADVFDALCSNRVYRPAWDIENVLDHFRKQSGENYDPFLVDILLDNVDEFLALRDKFPDCQAEEHSAIVNWNSKHQNKPTIVKTDRTDVDDPTNQLERVLVCETTPEIKGRLEATLGECGYKTEFTEDFNEAWKVLKGDDAPRLAILDLDHNAADSIELCKKLRRLQANHYTYIIMLAETSLHDLITEAKEAGADTWVSTPIHDDLLKACMAAAQRIIDLQNELIAARETMRNQATKDNLTQLWNRGAILDILKSEMNRAKREETSLGLLLADIDNFKNINDTYGHQAGDNVLKEAAFRIKNAIRPYDGFARYGGEEFLLVLPRCDTTFATYVAERLRKAVCAAPIEFDGQEINVTISVGITSKCNIKESDADQLIKMADQALYQAKADGRNCVKAIQTG